MEKVRGIGGLFLRARDPQALAGWCRDVLGIDMTSGIWFQEQGPTVFAPFSESDDYFDTDRRWMLNFRVADLDKMTAQLSAAGIEIITRPEWDSEIGRFARIHDPEGNPVELWQPPEIPSAG